MRKFIHELGKKMGMTINNINSILILSNSFYLIFVGFKRFYIKMTENICDQVKRIQIQTLE